LTSTSFLLFIYLSILRTPPTSTLFPYTTLFRSRQYARIPQRVRSQRSRHAQLFEGWYARVFRGRATATGKEGRSRCGHGREGRGDRKSTRLNSSHQIISYAVFCLKKKKKIRKKN